MKKNLLKCSLFMVVFVLNLLVVHGETSKGIKKFNEIRKSMNESIETKVFKEKKENRINTMEKGFKNSKDRIEYLIEEEKEILKIESELGIISKKETRFLGVEFNKEYSDFNSNNKKVEELLKENKELKKVLKKLNQMENKLMLKKELNYESK